MVFSKTQWWFNWWWRIISTNADVYKTCVSAHKKFCLYQQNLSVLTKYKPVEPNVCKTDLVGRLERVCIIQPIWINISFLVTQWYMCAKKLQKFEISGIQTICNISSLHMMIMFALVTKQVVKRIIFWHENQFCGN